MSQKDQKHRFGVGGEIISISKKGAEYKLNTIKEREEIRKYYVKYDGREFPIKQALNAVAPNLMRAGFNTTDAVRVFRRLGFTVGEKD
jgi:hypothetical protein